MKEKQKPQIVGGKRKIAVPKPQPQEVDGEKKKKLVLYKVEGKRKETALKQEPHKVEAKNTTMWILQTKIVEEKKKKPRVPRKLAIP